MLGLILGGRAVPRTALAAFRLSQHTPISSHLFSLLLCGALRINGLMLTSVEGEQEKFIEGSLGSQAMSCAFEVKHLCP